MMSEEEFGRSPLSSTQEGQRGPADHARRTQIVEVARQLFQIHGYGRTTVGDIAKVIGVSPAYIYKFFKSKQAIGDVVSALTIEPLNVGLRALADEDRSASERLRQLYRLLLEKGFVLLDESPNLYDLLTAAVDERWSSIEAHRTVVLEVIQRLVADGRARGEFERKTPILEVVSAIRSSLTPLRHPVIIRQRQRAELREQAEVVASLVLRSLAP